MKNITTFLALALCLLVKAQGTVEWVLLPPGYTDGKSCPSSTDCGQDILCFGLQYTPAYTGELTSYTTGFMTSCTTNSDLFIGNQSCTMEDNSSSMDVCNKHQIHFFNSSGNTGSLRITKGKPIILHQVCLKIPEGENLTIDLDDITGLTFSIDLDDGTYETDDASYDSFTINRDEICLDLCTKKPNLVGSPLSTFTGISTLDRNVESTWVTDARSGFLKLESKTLGFVPTRVPNTNQITNPEEGMVVWNTTTQCLEYYNGTEWVCSSNKCK